MRAGFFCSGGSGSVREPVGSCGETAHSPQRQLTGCVSPPLSCFFFFLENKLSSECHQCFGKVFAVPTHPRTNISMWPSVHLLTQDFPTPLERQVGGTPSGEQCFALCGPGSRVRVFTQQPSLGLLGARNGKERGCLGSLPLGGPPAPGHTPGSRHMAPY